MILKSCSLRCEEFQVVLDKIILIPFFCPFGLLVQKNVTQYVVI